MTDTSQDTAPAPAKTDLYQHVFVFPRPLPVLQADQHAHKFARAGYRKKWRKRMAEYVMVNGPTKVRPRAPLTRVRLDCTRHSLVRCEYDNLVYSFKALQDSLVASFILESDHDSVIVERSYYWEQAESKERQAVTVVVTELAAPESPPAGA